MAFLMGMDAESLDISEIIPTRPTALITGASFGLGWQFARCLAQDGYDLILVARSRDRLETIRQQLIEKYRIEVTIIVEDLSDVSASTRIAKKLDESRIDLDVLVNNAGFGLRGPVLELSLESQLEMIQLNVSALTALTHRIANKMVRRGKGNILNIASTAAFQPGPYMAVYYASKAFVLAFSEALAFELRDTGVRVTCHCPGATNTEFAKRADLDHSLLFSAGVASPDVVARHGYQAMNNGRMVAIPGFINWLTAVLVGCVPRRLVLRAVARLHRTAS